MKITQTGIAVAVALIAIIFFFLYGGLSFFTPPTGSDGAPALSDSQNNTMPASDTAQLQVTDETVGTGATAAAGDTVTVNYVGSLSDGTVFDASANHGSSGFTFTLGAGQVIAGWDQGLVGMKEGGKRKLVIPPSLAYGSQGAGNVIPPNATLTFEVDLLKVQKP